MNALPLAIFLALVSCSKKTEAPPEATAAIAAKSYHATGLIKSFGPSRAFVNIAHDDIPGYMPAMTMSFEPKTPDQISSLAVGDRVSFDFVETDDARRVITKIQKL